MCDVECEDADFEQAELDESEEEQLNPEEQTVKELRSLGDGLTRHDVDAIKVLRKPPQNLLRALTAVFSVLLSQPEGHLNWTIIKGHMAYGGKFRAWLRNFQASTLTAAGAQLLETRAAELGEEKERICQVLVAWMRGVTLGFRLIERVHPEKTSPSRPMVCCQTEKMG